MREDGRQSFTRAPRAIGEILNDVFRKPLRSRRQELHRLTEAWCVSTGPEVARQTRVVSLSGGTLTIHVESAVLRHELEAYRKGEILERLRRECPDRNIVGLRCILRA